MVLIGNVAHASIVSPCFFAAAMGKVAPATWGFQISGMNGAASEVPRCSSSARISLVFLTVVQKDRHTAGTPMRLWHTKLPVLEVYLPAPYRVLDKLMINCKRMGIDGIRETDFVGAECQPCVPHALSATTRSDQGPSGGRSLIGDLDLHLWRSWLSGGCHLPQPHSHNTPPPRLQRDDTICSPLDCNSKKATTGIEPAIS